MGTDVRPASTTAASWDAFSDADGTRPLQTGPKPALSGGALRQAITAIWCVVFCGLQWRAIGQLSGLPFGTDPAGAVAALARPTAPDVALGLR